MRVRGYVGMASGAYSLAGTRVGAALALAASSTCENSSLKVILRDRSAGRRPRKQCRFTLGAGRDAGDAKFVQRCGAGTCTLGQVGPLQAGPRPFRRARAPMAGRFTVRFYESFKQLAILGYHRKARIECGCGSAGFY